MIGEWDDLDDIAEQFRYGGKGLSRKITKRQ